MTVAAETLTVRVVAQEDIDHLFQASHLVVAQVRKRRFQSQPALGILVQ